MFIILRDFLFSSCAGYDKNGDGKVTVAEFKRVMARTSHLSDKAIEDMIRKADVDKDGSGVFLSQGIIFFCVFCFRCVNFKEFAKMMS